MNPKSKYVVQHKLVNSTDWSDYLFKGTRHAAFAVRDAKRYLDRDGIEYRAVERIGDKDTVIERVTA